MYYLVLYRPLFKLGFNHGIISHFKEVNRDSYQDGCLISSFLEHDKTANLMSGCKLSRVKDVRNSAVTTVNKLEFDCM